MLNVSNNKIALSIIFYVVAIIGVFLYYLRLPFVVLQRGTRKDVGKLAVEMMLMIAFFGGLFWLAFQFQFLGVVIHCWLIPLLCGAIIANLRGGWAEHELTDPGHPLTHTRTVTSNRIYSFFNINLNYHIEHHLFPSIPWYNLPKLHRLLLPEYQAAGASIYSSYFAFVWDAFKIGIHGRAPDEKEQESAAIKV
jgi:fatty acid desaturase